MLLACACAGSPQAPTLEALLARVDERLNEAEPEMIACFERELGPLVDQLSGRVVASVEIDTDGLVKNLTLLESELDSEAADLCVADAIRRVYFDVWVDHKPVRVTKPYHFSAGR